MSRHLGLVFLLLILALLLVVGTGHDPGYVLISWGRTSLEMSLILAAVLWLGSLWLLVRLADLERWLLRAWRQRGGHPRGNAQEIAENRSSRSGQA